MKEKAEERGKMNMTSASTKMKRGPWTEEEDEKLVKCIEKEGEGKWRTMGKRANLLRCGKSCRLRWMNYLRPSLKRGPFSPEEDDLILRLHRLLRNRWSLIAGRIPGRTDNEIKNYWNTHLSKKLLRQGIDPRTHMPLDHANKAKGKNVQVDYSSPSSCGHHHHLHSGMIMMSTTTLNAGDGANNLNENIVSRGDGEDGHHGHHDDQDHRPHHDHQLFDDQIMIQTGSQSRDDDDFEFFYDDTFSSFLDSLINEDPFGNSSLQLGECSNEAVPSNVTSHASDDPMVEPEKN